MRRILIWICALLALAALSAGAEGNRLLEMEGDAYLRSMTAVGDRAVLVADEKLYTWREGEDALAEWTGDIHLENPYMDEQRDFESIGLYEVAFFADGDALRGARILNGEDYSPRAIQLFDVAFLEDGRVVAENATELALPDALSGAEWFSVNGIVVREGAIVMLLSAEGDMLCVLDPEAPRSARVEALQSWGNRLLNGEGGALLVSEEYGPEGQAAVISRVNADASLDELCRLSAPVDSFAADPASGVLFAASGGRLCPVDLDAGTLGAPVAALPIEAQRAALLSGGRWYVAAMQNGGAVALDTTGTLDEDALLTVMADGSSDDVRRAVLRFAVEHPEATPVLQYDCGDVLEAVTTHSADADVYILDLHYRSAYQALLERGFMLPLEDSATIRGLCDRLYPGVRPYLSRDGVPVAVPVSASGGCMGVDPLLLEKLGLSVDDVPRDWNGFLDFLEAQVRPNLDKLGEKERFTYDDMTDTGLRYFLFQEILRDWEQANRDAGQIPDYEDPRLVAALEKLDGMDFTEYGLAEDSGEEDGYGYGWGSDTRYLIQFSREFTLGDDPGELEGLPLALGFGEDLPGSFALSLTVAFVNPYSAHAEAAVAFLETLADGLSTGTLYTLCPDLDEPVKRPDWEKTLAHFDESIARVREQMEAAEPAERQELEETLEYLTGSRKDFEERDVWLISREALDQYRAIGDRLTVSLPGWFEKDGSGEAWELMEQYRSRLISAREFLSAVNRKARMMAREEG